jgi:uncharacterized coiled-coil protein SlyX
MAHLVLLLAPRGAGLHGISSARGQCLGTVGAHATPLWPRRTSRVALRCIRATGFPPARRWDKYRDVVPESESRRRGECFVFDERVALGHGLRERQTGNASDEGRKDARRTHRRTGNTADVQDETIETLNKTITAQWLKIDALTRQLAALSERLEEARRRTRRMPRTNRRRIIRISRGWCMPQNPGDPRTRALRGCAGDAPEMMNGKKKRPPRRRPFPNRLNLDC